MIRRPFFPPFPQTGPAPLPAATLAYLPRESGVNNADYPPGNCFIDRAVPLEQQSRKRGWPRASHLRPFSPPPVPAPLTLHRFTSRFEEGEDSKSKFPSLPFFSRSFLLLSFPELSDNFVVAVISPPLLPLVLPFSTRTRLIFPQRRGEELRQSAPIQSVSTRKRGNYPRNRVIISSKTDSPEKTNFTDAKGKGGNVEGLSRKRKRKEEKKKKIRFSFVSPAGSSPPPPSLPSIYVGA